MDPSVLALLVGVLAVSGAAGFFVHDARPERSRLGQFAAWSLLFSYLGVAAILGAVHKSDLTLARQLSVPPESVQFVLLSSFLVGVPVLFGLSVSGWMRYSPRFWRAAFVGAGFASVVACLALIARTR